MARLLLVFLHPVNASTGPVGPRQVMATMAGIANAMQCKENFMSDLPNPRGPRVPHIQRNASNQSATEQLRQQMLRQMKDAGLREAMLTEYKEMAATVSSLLHTLAKEGIPEALSDAGQAKYGECMARLTQSSMRCHLLTQESQETDAMLHLAASDTSQDRIQ